MREMAACVERSCQHGLGGYGEGRVCWETEMSTSPRYRDEERVHVDTKQELGRSSGHPLEPPYASLRACGASELLLSRFPPPSDRTRRASPSHHVALRLCEWSKSVLRTSRFHPTSFKTASLSSSCSSVRAVTARNWVSVSRWAGVRWLIGEWESCWRP